MTQKFRKKPITVHAMRVMDSEDVDKAAEWMRLYDVDYNILRYPDDTLIFTITTLEGDLRWKPGAWLIKGVHDEFYFCDNNVFRKTYDFVEVDE